MPSAGANVLLPGPQDMLNVIMHGNPMRLITGSSGARAVVLQFHHSQSIALLIAAGFTQRILVTPGPGEAHLSTPQTPEQQLPPHPLITAIVPSAGQGVGWPQLVGQSQSP